MASVRSAVLPAPCTMSRSREIAESSPTMPSAKLLHVSISQNTQVSVQVAVEKERGSVIWSCMPLRLSQPPEFHGPATLLKQFHPQDWRRLLCTTLS